MAYVTSLYTRATRSARGELFNPLIYPFLLTTFAYGVGFTLFGWTEAVKISLLYKAMMAVAPFMPIVWGALCIVVIVLGLYVIVFDKPPIGKANCMVAWLLWAYATMCFLLTGAWLTVFTVGLPSLFFWTWQYFRLSELRREDVLDGRTMERYDSGLYDDGDNPDARKDRRDNRGVDEADRDIRS